MKPIIKNTGKLILLFIISALTFNTAYPQNTRKEKEAQKVADVKKMVEARSYIFKAEFANPMRGGNRSLTSEYDLTVGNDTIIAYLPYFGRAYVAPMNPSEGGIKFTSTKFDYNTKAAKKGNWDITIKPKDVQDVQQLFLTITTDGYATLHIINLNRDAISFQGYIQGKPKKK